MKEIERQDIFDYLGRDKEIEAVYNCLLEENPYLDKHRFYLLMINLIVSKLDKIKLVPTFPTSERHSVPLPNFRPDDLEKPL